MDIPLSPCVPENLVSRDGFSRPVPRQPAHLRTQAESGAYLRDSSRVPRRRPFMKPPYAIGSVPSLSGHAVAYRWRSLPRVRRHRASKPQGSSERVLPWQITMDQLIFASLSHTHCWYEVGMLKVPAVPTLSVRKERTQILFWCKNRTHDFRTSRCAGYLLDHYGNKNKNKYRVLWTCDKIYTTRYILVLGTNKRTPK